MRGCQSAAARTAGATSDDVTGVVQVPPLANGQSGRAMIRVGSQLSDDISLYSIDLESGDQPCVVVNDFLHITTALIGALLI
jgi:hypothetical protein